MSGIFSSSITDLSNQYKKLISSMMAVERTPVRKLQSQKSDLNIKSAMFTDLKETLAGVKSSAETLAKTGTSSIFQTAKTLSTSDSDVVTASTSSSAADGIYNLDVTKLATATSMSSTAQLNTHKSARSSNQVVAGSGTIDTSKSFANADFDNTPTGTVTINDGVHGDWVSADLSSYGSVNDFLEDIEDNTDANIYYDSTRDKFVIESTTSNDLTISGNFFNEVNITGPVNFDDSTIGIETDVVLSEANFDTAVSGTGSFNINGVEIDWDASADTLNDIISRINNSNAEVTAFYDDETDKVIMTSNTTGSETISLSDVTGTLLGSTLNLSEGSQTAGDDATFTINGSDAMTRSSNTFDLNGTTFTLHSAGSSTVNIGRNDSEITSKVETFLSNINAVTDYIKGKSAVDPETYTRGGLAGQTTYTSLPRRLRSILLSEVSGMDGNKPNSLRDIGITFDSDLEIEISDSEKFSDALVENPNILEDIFNSSNGVATKIDSLIGSYVDDSGIIDNTVESLSSRMDRIQDRIDDMNGRMTKKEEYLNNKFNSMFENLVVLRQQYSTVQMFQSITGY